MRRLGIAPKNQDIKNAVPSVDDWFQITTLRMNVSEGAANPTVAEVPENQWVVYRNTTIPEVRIWTNISGVLLKSAAFT